MLVKILSHPGHDISKCYMEATGPAIGPWGAWMAPGFLSLSKVVLDQYVCVQLLYQEVFIVSVRANMARNTFKISAVYN